LLDTLVIISTYVINMSLSVVVEYASSQRKRILLLRMEANYVPDGWLRIKFGSRINHDFSDPTKFDDEWEKLHIKLEKFNNSGCDKRFLL